MLDIPIAIPVAVRTADDYGLRFSVAEITQLIPLQAAKFILWGMPGAGATTRSASRKAPPETRRAAQKWKEPAASAKT